MTTPQPGIFAQGTRSHHYLEYDLRPDATRGEVVNVLAALREPPVTAGGANLVLGLSRRALELLDGGSDGGGGVPAALRPFDAIAGPGGTAPATQHDVWLWIHGTNSDVTVDVGRAATVALAPVATLAHELPAFVYKESRDFSGFIDGTENPPVWEAPLVAAVPDGPGAGGSYVLVMQFVHDLGAFHALPEEEQERVIGRTKDDSEELDDAVKPGNAHISRVVIEDEDGEELEIYRRSTPWGNVREQGLNFVGFSNDLGLLDEMLGRMYGTRGDGPTDRILEFTQAVTGAYYFAPSLHDLQRWHVAE
jgi:putative iron-dependent peroxidase